MKKTISVAAIILLAILLCGVLVGCNNSVSMVTLKVVPMPSVSGIYVPPFLCMTFSAEGKKVVFQTKATTYIDGEKQDPSERNVANGEDLTWMPNQRELDKSQKVVVEVIVIDDRQVAGYLVISATVDTRNAQDVKISAKVVKEENFRQRDGSYKQMTKEQVQQLIDQAVQKA